MPTPPTIRLILASASPRRAELLRGAGYSFEVMAPPDDEPALVQDGHPAAQAEKISLFKARSVQTQCGLGRAKPRGAGTHRCGVASKTLRKDVENRSSVILAADTIVALRGEVFGKPRDESDARRILSRLSGSAHHVITGVTLLSIDGFRARTSHDVTGVTMRAMTSRELDAYLATGEWRGKAGAYGIQDSGDAFIERFEGSFSNVVGLPLELLAAMLDEWTGVVD